MQIKTYGNDNIRIGSILPKEITKLSVECQDQELKNKIESLIALMNKKLIPKKENIENEEFIDMVPIEEYRDWENIDYIIFRKRLSIMSISTFIRIYDIMMEYLKLSKKELEKELRSLDKLLELHTFDDKRVIRNSSQIFEYVPHVFSSADLPKFLQDFDSKIFSFSNIIFKEYERRVDPNLGTNDKIAELKLLLESLRENNEDLIKLIQDEYFSFISRLPKNHILHLYLKNTYNTIISNNKRYLEIKLADFNLNATKKNRQYFTFQKNSYFSNKAKEKVKKEGYRFG